MPRNDDLWFTRTQAAALVGLSTRQFDDAIRPRLEKTATRGVGTGTPVRICGPAAVKAWHEYRVEITTVNKAIAGDDPLMQEGADSPALEKFREARAGQEQIKLAEMQNAVARTDQLKDAMQSGMSVLRAAGQRLERAYGNGAGEIYNEGVTEFEQAAMKALENQKQ